jgi:hypothetical protein
VALIESDGELTRRLGHATFSEQALAPAMTLMTPDDH